MIADVLCQIGFCVAPGLHTILDPLTGEYLPTCAHHYTQLRRIEVAMAAQTRASTRQTWLGV